MSKHGLLDYVDLLRLLILFYEFCTVIKAIRSQNKNDYPLFCIDSLHMYVSKTLLFLLFCCMLVLITKLSHLSLSLIVTQLREDQTCLANPLTTQVCILIDTHYSSS